MFFTFTPITINSQILLGYTSFYWGPGPLAGYFTANSVKMDDSRTKCTWWPLTSLATLFTMNSDESFFAWAWWRRLATPVTKNSDDLCIVWPKAAVTLAIYLINCLDQATWSRNFLNQELNSSQHNSLSTLSLKCDQYCRVDQLFPLEY